MKPRTWDHQTRNYGTSESSAKIKEADTFLLDNAKLNIPPGHLANLVRAYPGLAPEVSDADIVSALVEALRHAGINLIPDLQVPLSIFPGRRLLSTPIPGHSSFEILPEAALNGCIPLHAGEPLMIYGQFKTAETT